MPANVFEWDGWQGQYRRMRRWFDRLARVANDWDRYSMDEQIDYVLVFFQTAYHLRDYLLAEAVVGQRALDELMQGSQSLRAARDLANGSKHRVITRPSRDAAPWISRTLNFSAEPRLTLKVDPRQEDLLAVAAACLGDWDSFLGRHSLDPQSFSPHAQALRDALAARHFPGQDG